MKNKTKIAIIGSTVLLVAGTLTGITLGKHFKNDDKANDKFGVGGVSLASFKKMSLDSADTPVVSSVFTQVMEIEETHYLRFAVAVDATRVKEVSITRQVAEHEDNTRKFDTVYKGLKTANGGLYYDSSKDELTTIEALRDENYYFASYSIELTSESLDLEFTAFGTVIDVEDNELDTPTLETTYEIEEETNWTVNFFNISGDLLGAKKVIDGGTVTPIDYDPGEDFYWSEDGEIFNFGTPITQNTDLYAVIDERETYAHYAEVIPFGEHPGCKEYWEAADETRVYEEPQDAKITEATHEEGFVDTLTPEDARYIAPVRWTVGSTGKSVAYMGWSDDGNVILDARLDSGDTQFALTTEYINENNTVAATMVQITFNILSISSNNPSIWYKNQIDGDSGSDVNVGSHTIIARVGQPIIFRNGLRAEVESIYFVDPYLILNENSTRTDYFGVYNSTRNEDGLLDNFEYVTDGVTNFCEKVGFSGEYVGGLYEGGIRSISFNLTRTGGDMTRLIVMEGTTKHETYPQNGIVTIDIYGSYPVYIDACVNGGGAAAATIEMEDIEYIIPVVEYTHYSEINPTATLPGCKEYWQIDDGAPLFEAPTEGTVVEGTHPDRFLEDLSSNDVRYIAPTNWIAPSEVKQSWNGDNVVLDASAISGDANVNLTQAYHDAHKCVDGKEFFVKFKALTTGGSIWAFTASGNAFGEDLTEGNTVGFVSSINSNIILRGGVKVEVVKVEYVSPDVVVPGFAYELFDFSINNGLMTEMTIGTDGVHDFNNRVGFAPSYMKKLYDAGYTKMSFDLARTGGSLARMHVNGPEGDVVSYPSNGRVTIDIKGEYGVYIDACGDGGVVAEAVVELTNFSYSSPKSEARETLAKKFFNNDTAWSYVHHADGTANVSDNGAVYNLHGQTSFTLLSHFVYLMKTAGYKNVLVNVQALNPQDEIVDIGYTTIKTGVAWDAQWEYKAGTNSDFLIDVSAWCENLSDDESNVAIFTARNSSGANVNTDFRIELKGFYEEGQADRFNGNPKQIGVFDEAGEKGLYVRFKYITSDNNRALIWGKTSSKIVDAPAFAACTDLSAVPGYGAGWYEFYLAAGSLDNDNALWLASDTDTRALISFGYTSAAI